MDPKRFEKQLAFLKETDRLKHILRRTVLMDTSRRENDAEHSWHLALYAMVLSEYAQERGVRMDKVLQMVIVHDLVEIYAGDTFAYDVKGNLDKSEREQKAADKLFGLLPDDQGMHLRELWEEFDAMNTPESLYAAAMDRFQPFFHNTETNGYTWVESKVAKQQVLERMEPIHRGAPELWDFILAQIESALKNGYLTE